MHAKTRVNALMAREDARKRADALPPAFSTAHRSQRRLTAPRRRAKHIHELSHRAQIFQITHSFDCPGDGRWGQHALRIGAEFALDLSARQRVLGAAAGIVAARGERPAVVALDLDHRLHAAKRRIATYLDLFG